jgi:hypothetical protein
VEAAMSNPQQPEIRRSEKSPTTKQRTEDANPTDAPGGIHDRTGDRPVPEGQVSPYGPAGRTASDKS